MIYYVIPARRGSKGLPFKNRTLIRVAVQQIPPEARPQTIVTTDDDEIRAWVSEQGIRFIDRPVALASDEASIKPVMEHAVCSVGMSKDDLVVMLFLTYPQRAWKDIQGALAFFHDHGTSSLACRKIPKTHPFLAYLALPNAKGCRAIDHPLYRRQDYPECFEVSHFISIFRAGALPFLDDRLLDADSIYYPIDDVIDVDTPADLLAYQRHDHGC